MDRESEIVLDLVSRSLQFATRHPYAATGIFGAAIGSAVTYKVLTLKPRSMGLNNIFTPKVYELELSTPDLQHLLNEPKTELRWETPEVTVVITGEKRKALKELPVIDHKEKP